MRFPLQYLAGIIADDTVLARAGRYIDADKVRFVRPEPGAPHRAQLIGGWERLVRTAVTGICRTTFAWSDNSGRLNIAFGTHSKLMVWRGGALYDITPFGPPSRLGTDPLAMTNLSTTVVVTQTAHGYANGIDVAVYGAAAANGIAAANLNGVHTITVIGVDSYSYVAGSADAASATATGGGTGIVVVPQTALPAGAINGTGTAGYGTGGYGVGGYSQPSEDDYFPRTWSFGLLGEVLVASNRDGAIYTWSNDSTARATWLENSPLRNASILTTPERVIMALGTEQEVSPHTYNPRCLRHSDYRDETVWNTDTDTLAREKVLEGAGRIVAGRMAGPNPFIWTDNELYEAAYVGALDEVYSFDRRGEDCGAIGPNAMTVKGQRGFWLTPDQQYMTCTLGGEPAPVECPFRAELRANLTPSQRDKIVLSTLSAFGEVWTFYPDARDGLENSRAMFFSIADGWWSKAQLARTAFCDSGPADYAVGVDVDGNAFWHERGTTNDGNRFTYALSAGPLYIDNGSRAVFLRGFYPDFKDQVGTLNLYVSTRETAQSADVEQGPFMMSSDTEKVDLHLDGVILSWRIEGEAGPASFRMGTPWAEGKYGRRTK